MDGSIKPKKRMVWRSKSVDFTNESTDMVVKKMSKKRKRQINGIINLAFESTQPQLTDFVIEALNGESQNLTNSNSKGWNIDDHRVPLRELYKRYETDPKIGLEEDKVRKNHLKYGPNKMFPPKTSLEIVKFAKNCLFGLNLLFWICGLISITCYFAQYLYTDDIDADNLWSGVILLVVVLISGSFSYYQELKSSQIMSSFRSMIPNFATVLRGGHLIEIPVEDVVVGDIVELRYGDRVPADIRIIQSDDSLRVDNSSLTGESEPQRRSHSYTDANPMETSNVVFFSTKVVEGSGRGVVFRVGQGTFMGRLASLATAIRPSDTPIAREMNHVILVMTFVSLIFGIIFLAVGLYLNYTLIAAIFFSIGIIIANVPESLNVTLTIILALTAKKMARKNCLVKHLHAVETLGSASVICSDKTGTLTQNKMSVAHMWFDGKMAEADTLKFESGKNPGFSALSTVAILCSRARFKKSKQQSQPSSNGGGQIVDKKNDTPIQKREVEGDSSEAAILKCMEIQIGNVEKMREKSPKVFEIPFNSRNKFQVSIHDTKDWLDPRYLLVMKGAPEIIVDLCTTILVNNKEVELTQFWRQKIDDAYTKFGELGERVFGFCDCRLPVKNFPKGEYKFSVDNPDFLKIGLRFVGLMSMIDPPRAAVPGSVQKCKRAGIKVVMVTGDHPITATAIARAVGIISEGSKTIQEISAEERIQICDLDPDLARAVVVTGTRLADMTEQELDDLLRNKDEIVFARTSPEQKYQIVTAFQRIGKVVAVTGDGVNDAPALKRADIGVAMGMTGTDVAKEVADMILPDDNFASLASGVEDGRLIFDNLRKLFRFVMADNVAEMYCYWIFIILKVPLPTGTIAMLLSTSGTDILPAISLAYESSEADIMKLKPRNLQKDSLVTKAALSYAYGQVSVIQTLAGFFAYFVVFAHHGWLPGRLLFIQGQWDSEGVQDLEDSYGQEWTHAARGQLQITAQTAFFVALVAMQWVNTVACKTRRLSVFQKKMKNPVMNCALVVSPLMAAFFIYTPGLNTACNLHPVSWHVFVAVVPFMLLLFIYDEARRWAIRSFRGGWVADEFYV